VIILDTNVVSELMRGGTPPFSAWLERAAGADLVTTAVTRAEIRYGIARLPEGERRRRLEAAADEVFSTMADKVLAFDNRAADECGPLVADRERIGRPIGVADALIAAVARSRRATVATRNTTDFEGCGIAVVDPWVESGAIGRPGSA
jgi:predicted nucleic acid-binding protein